MATLVEPTNSGDLLKQEASTLYSREQATVLAGSGSDRVLVVGEVIGKELFGTVTVAPDAGNTGDGDIDTMSTSAKAQTGDYELEMVEAPSVLDAVPVATPDGGNTGDGVVGTISTGTGAQLGDYILTCVTAPDTPNTTGTASAVTGTGNGVFGAVTTGANVKSGTYTVTFITADTNVGDFMVEDPDGVMVGIGTVAAAFSLKDHILFTIADGSTDFIVGDYFTVVVGTTGAGGLFTVVGPDNASLPNAVIGTAYTGQVNFTIADGSADWIVGDFVTIAVISTGAGGVWTVTAPDGASLPTAVVGTAYTSEQINFTIDDGSADWIVGDLATITVPAGDGKVVALDLTAVDGTQRAYGVILLDVTAVNGTDNEGVIMVRDCVLSSDFITYPAGITAGETVIVNNELKAKGIVLRSGV